MSKRNQTRLERLLGVRKPTKSALPMFIREPIAKVAFYEGILQRIANAEELLLTNRGDRAGKTLRVVFEVFPLVDTISYNLFGKSGRYYLEELGYSKREADVMFRMFRNGHAHNGSSYRLKYDDGEVTWGLMSGGGTGRPRPYYPGYIDDEHPEDNDPAEEVFDYVEMSDGSYHASLTIDRLLAHIKYDITQRSVSDAGGDIDIIVGQYVDGKRRKPSKKYSNPK